jgi:hypothetical protein
MTYARCPYLMEMRTKGQKQACTAIAFGRHRMPVHLKCEGAPSPSSRCGSQQSIPQGKVATVNIGSGNITVLRYLFKPIIESKETALREP